MSTLIAITGTLKDLQGNVLPNTQVTFVRSGVAGQDSSVVVPRTVTTTSDASGVVSFSMFAGNYTATTIGADSGTVEFSVAVPETPLTNTLDVMIDAAPTTVTPQAVLDAQAARDAAAASATDAATSATEAEGWANASAASAASAASVVQQDLSAYAVTLSNYTPVDVVVGRMADWSDGGFNMRVIQPRTSWYNETLVSGNWLGEAADETAARVISGAGTGSYYHNTTDGKFYSLNATSGQTEVFRGNKAGFPEEYVVVAEASRVIIFDATDPDLPMWMVFVGANVNMLRTNGDVSSIAFYDGTLVFCDNNNFAGGTFNFLLDGKDMPRDLRNVPYNGNIAQRNDGLSAAPNAPNVVSQYVNDVAITALPDAPIDPATGMPVPTIAVATDGGVSVIKDDGNVWDLTNASWPLSGTVAFHGEYIIANWGAVSADNGHYYAVKTASITTDMTTSSMIDLGGIHGYGGTYPYIGHNTGKSKPIVGTLAALTLNSSNSGTGVNGQHLTLYNFNPATPASGMVNYLTTTYLSGWMPGDIRGAWLADTTAETITGAELVTNGTFDTSTTGWTAGGTATLSVVSGRLRITNGSGGYGSAWQAVSCVPGKDYTISWDVSAPGTLYATRVVVDDETGFASPNTAVSQAAAVTGTQQLTFTATAATHYILLQVFTATSSVSMDFDNVSVRLADPDRSVKGNGLQVFGSLTKTAVATGADLVAYSGFSATNYLQQPYNSDLDFGTGDFCIMGWVYIPSGHSTTDAILKRGQVATGYYDIATLGSSGMRFGADDGSHPFTSVGFGDIRGRWTFFVATVRSGTMEAWVDGVLQASTSSGGMSFTDTSASEPLYIGNDNDLSSLKLTLLRIGATAPSADQIKHIYETEKVLFQDNAKCTLYGSSDAVTDMAYDEIKGLLHVGTSGGRSTFDGLRRIDNSTTAVTKLAANNGLLVEM